MGVREKCWGRDYGGVQGDSIIRKLAFLVKLFRNQYKLVQFIHQRLGLKSKDLGIPSTSYFGTQKLPPSSPVRQRHGLCLSLCPTLAENLAHKVLLPHGPTWKTQTHWVLSSFHYVQTLPALHRTGPCENLALYTLYILTHSIFITIPQVKTIIILILWREKQMPREVKECHQATQLISGRARI